MQKRQSRSAEASLLTYHVTRSAYLSWLSTTESHVRSKVRSGKSGRYVFSSLSRANVALCQFAVHMRVAPLDKVLVAWYWCQHSACDQSQHVCPARVRVEVGGMFSQHYLALVSPYVNLPYICVFLYWVRSLVAWHWCQHSACSQSQHVCPARVQYDHDLRSQIHQRDAR